MAPVASRHDRDDSYPYELVEKMAELGLFGIAVPEEYGGLGLDHATFAMIFEELAKGWMSITGVLGTHSVMAYVLSHFGTEEQKRRWLPRMASGEIRGALAMTEPEAGSDVAAIQTVAARDGDEYVVNGRKLFITNGRNCHAALVMVKTDLGARPAHRGISALVVEKGPGFGVGPDMEKLGYRGVDTCELIFDNCLAPAGNLVGMQEGQGISSGHGGVRGGADKHSGAGSGGRDGGLRGGYPVCTASGDFRQAHRATPVDTGDAGGDGDEDSRRAAVDLRRGGQEGQGRAVRRGGGDGEAVRQRSLRRGDAGRHADTRRVRVHQGPAVGAVLPGRAAYDYRGRHQRDTEANHCPQPVASVRSLGGA